MFSVPVNKRQNHHRLSQQITIYQFPQNNKKLPCFFFISTRIASKLWKALLLDRWIHHALDNWDTASLGNGVCYCKVLSATSSSTFWQQMFVYFRNKLGLVYCAASNHTTAYTEFDMMWHIVKQLLRASDCITRFYFFLLLLFLFCSHPHFLSHL